MDCSNGGRRTDGGNAERRTEEVRGLYGLYELNGLYREGGNAGMRSTERS